MLSTPGGSPASRDSSANSSAVSEVYSAGFSTTALPIASAGATFQASISSGKFHGMIAPQTPSASRPAISDGISCAMPGVVIEMPRDQRNVDVAALADRLAVVHRLQHREQPRLLLHDPRQRIKHPRPRLRVLRPSPLRLPRRRHRLGDVARAALRHARQHLARRRIAALERLARRGEPPADPVPEPPRMTVEPSVHLAPPLRRRPVFHRLEDVADGHASVFPLAGRGAVRPPRRAVPGAPPEDICRQKKGRTRITPARAGTRPNTARSHDAPAAARCRPAATKRRSGPGRGAASGRPARP